MYLTKYKLIDKDETIAQGAQDKVNQFLEQYENSNDTAVNFDLEIENSVAVGKFSETRYTLIIYIYDTTSDINYEE